MNSEYQTPHPDPHTTLLEISCTGSINLLYDDLSVQTKNVMSLQPKNPTQNIVNENDILSPLSETESSTSTEPQMDNTNLKHLDHDDYQNTNLVSTHQRIQNNQENNQ